LPLHHSPSNSRSYFCCFILHLVFFVHQISCATLCLWLIFFSTRDVEFKRLHNVRTNSVLAHAVGDRGLTSIGERLLEVQCNPISR
jgi:hypothetical protein